MPTFNLIKQLIFAAILGLLAKQCLANELPLQPVDAQTQERKTARDNAKPADWLTHAMLSYQQWQQGNTVDAMHEGEEAVKLNSENSTALINLALMKQRANQFDEAIALYWQAAQLIPESWVPPLGIARCFILNHNDADGRGTLEVMSEKTNGNFDWYYMTARTWLEIDDLNMAEKTAGQAVAASTKPGQRAAAENLQFLALMRAGKNDQAKLLQQKVLHNNLGRNSELYVRSALTLIPVDDPATGKDLLNKAIENLHDEATADSLLKLGTIFQDKAESRSCDKANRTLWLENAQTAYAQAVAKRPNAPDFHFALASIYSGEGERQKTADELKKFSSLERSDILAPFLLSKIAASTTQANEPVPLNLSLVKFKIDGLNCPCHLSKIHEVLRKTNGVVFISTPPQKPFSGFVLVDQSLTPARDMLARCSSNALSLKLDPQGHPIYFTLEMTSEEPVKSVTDALKIAKQIRFSPILTFQKTYSEYVTRFQEISPIMPLDSHDTASGIATAASWNVPL